MEQAGHPSRAFGAGVFEGPQGDFGLVLSVESLYLQHGQGRFLTCNAPDEVYAGQQLVAYNCVRMHAAAIRRRLGLTGSDLPDLWRVGADVITVTSPKCMTTAGPSGQRSDPCVSCLPGSLPPSFHPSLPACLPASSRPPACFAKH